MLCYISATFYIFFSCTDAKASITEAKTATKQAEMKLKYSREELKKKEQEMKRTASEFTKDKSLLDRMEKEVKNLEVSRVENKYIPVTHHCIVGVV